MKKDLVLLINGAGTNGAELKSLYKQLAKNEKYFVYYPGFLPGGFVGEYFPKSTPVDFVEFIDETMELVNDDFDKVYLIGYSLGASTAAIMAARNERISKLVLISPIIKNPNYRKFLNGLGHSVSYSKNLTRIQKIFFKEFIVRFMRVSKIHIWHLQMYLHYTKRYLKMIRTKTLIIETLKDEMVKKKSIDLLVRSIDNEVIRHSVDSSHFLFFDRAVRNDVITRISSYLEEE